VAAIRDVTCRVVDGDVVEGDAGGLVDGEALNGSVLDVEVGDAR
jgi:hypothetical protein